MIAPLLRSVWAEARPVQPPQSRAAVTWDRVSTLALAVASVLEAFLRQGIAYRGAHAIVGVAFVLPLVFRREKPLGSFLVSFALAAVVPVAAGLVGIEWVDLHTGAFILLLPYSLVRWGSGREISIGLGALVGLYAIAFVRDRFHGTGDAVGGALVMLFPALTGATVRFRGNARRRELDAVRLEERAQIARELHDSVAHQLSAVALLAQGGIVVGETRPEEALQVLHLIEESAGKALGELRTLVGALRSDGAPALGPQPTLTDLKGLASAPHEPLAVTVSVVGPLDGPSLSTALQSAIYRIAQEAITNARRHAKRATRVRVELRVTPTAATLSITDDGQSRAARADRELGFGLVGMAERAGLLGGTLEAGPAPEGGWHVSANFPLRRGTS